MPLVINKKPEAKAEAVVEETTLQAESAEQAVSTDTVKRYGADRKKLAFVCPLGDPSNPDTTKVTAADGAVTTKVTSTIVGYRFRVLEDLRIPNCGTNEKFKNDPMNYDNIDAWIDVKAGTEVDLTPFETALLLSQESFNGGCDGGEKPVTCVYQFKTPKSKSGVATASAVATTPRVNLRAAQGSIKDFQIVDVLTTVTNLVNGVPRKTRTLNPGFDKWEPLAVSSVRKSSGGSTKAKNDPTTVANKSAEMFMKYVNNRKGLK